MNRIYVVLSIILYKLLIVTVLCTRLICIRNHTACGEKGGPSVDDHSMFGMLDVFYF
jgi:hypothetical protein